MSIPLISNLNITRNTFKELWLHVISRCNLSCYHCLFSCSPNSDEPGPLSLEECQKYITQALKQKIKAIYITGGEPLIWPPLLDLLSWYYSLENNVPLTILSNGTLITENMTKEFKKFIPMELSIRISLECYTPDNHEQYRGKGSFDKAIKGIKNLNSQGIIPWIAFVNKSGGSITQCQAYGLEKDFHQRLKEDYDINIAGLKIIGAYSKGRFSGMSNPILCQNQIEEKLASIQCTYGIAVSKLGIVPCPILVDTPKAVVNKPFSDLIGQTFSIDYEFCSSCFATGTSCGQ